MTYRDEFGNEYRHERAFLAEQLAHDEEVSSRREAAYREQLAEAAQAEADAIATEACGACGQLLDADDREIDGSVHDCPLDDR